MVITKKKKKRIDKVKFMNFALKPQGWSQVFGMSQVIVSHFSH